MKLILVGIKDDEHGDPIPVWDRMGVSVLRKIRDDSSTSPYFWAANYASDPLPVDAAAGYKREWFRVYEDKDRPGALDIAITVDLAITEAKEAKAAKRDRSAIVVSGVTEDFELYILDARAGRWGPETVMDLLMGMNATWNPRYIGIEQVAYQKALRLWLHVRALEKTGSGLPLRPLLPRAQSKEARSFPLSAHAAYKGIHIRQEHTTDFLQEFLRFPIGRHDDYVDALAYRMQDVRRPTMPRHLAPRVARLTPEMFEHKGPDLLTRAAGGGNIRGGHRRFRLVR